MWTAENRQRYNRDKLRYPSDLSDEEWALIEAFIPSAKRGGNRRVVDIRAVVNGLMYQLSTGCQCALHIRAMAIYSGQFSASQHGISLF